jgi:ribosomal subunit interface protein
MVVNVACRDSALSWNARQAVEDYSERLERYFSNILTVHWDLTTEGSEHLAGCRIHCAGASFRAHARANDFHLALHEVLDKLVRQRRREKQKHETARRDGRPALFGIPGRAASLSRGHNPF